MGIFASGTCHRWLVARVKVSWVEFVPCNRDPEMTFTLPPCEVIARRQPSLEAWNLPAPDSRTLQNVRLLFPSPPVLGILYCSPDRPRLSASFLCGCFQDLLSVSGFQHSIVSALVWFPLHLSDNVWVQLCLNLCILVVHQLWKDLSYHHQKYSLVLFSLPVTHRFFHLIIHRHWTPFCLSSFSVGYFLLSLSS